VSVDVTLAKGTDAANSGFSATFGTPTITQPIASPPPPPSTAEELPQFMDPTEFRVQPFDLAKATQINVNDLGPPDVRHDLSNIMPTRCFQDLAAAIEDPTCFGCHSSQVANPLSDLRLIINTVGCGQWASNHAATAMPGDTEGVSFAPVYGDSGVPPQCEAAVRASINAAPTNPGAARPDILHDSWEWRGETIRIFN